MATESPAPVSDTTNTADPSTATSEYEHSLPYVENRLGANELRKKEKKIMQTRAWEAVAVSLAVVALVVANFATRGTKPVSPQRVVATAAVATPVADKAMATKSDRKVAPHSATPNAKPRVPVLVELFTSEGCSSCPSADATLADLTQNQPVANAQIIALGEHVDYWDGRAWRDPFSQHKFTERQTEYSNAIAGSSVYTPQAVVDGTTEFIGSDASRAQSDIQAAARRPKAVVTLAAKMTAKPVAGNSVVLDIAVDKVPAGTGMVDVYAAFTEDNLSSNVRGGENSGRHLAHSSVVRDLVRVGMVNADSLKGKPYHSTATLPAPKVGKGNGHAVVFLQAQHSHRIVGAAMVDLR